MKSAMTKIRYPITKHTVTVTTDASGDFPEDVKVGGTIEKIMVDRNTLTSGAADITITDKVTGETILGLSNITADSIDYPRIVAQGNDGVDLDTAGDVCYVKPVADIITVTVAQGGDTKSGIIYIWTS